MKASAQALAEVKVQVLAAVQVSEGQESEVQLLALVSGSEVQLLALVSVQVSAQLRGHSFAQTQQLAESSIHLSRWRRKKQSWQSSERPK